MALLQGVYENPYHSIFEQRLKRGERVLWYEPDQTLCCYSHSFSGNLESTISLEQSDLFQLIHPKTTKSGELPWDYIVGVRFRCLPKQFRRSNNLLAAQDRDNNIPAVSVLKDLFVWWTEPECTIENTGNLQDAQRARAFLESEKILIPHSEWSQALNGMRSH